MQSLLGLPSELRIEILREVLGFYATTATESETERQYPVTSPPPRGVSFSAPDLKSLDASSVYLINKQIRQDALAASKLYHPVEYHLDLVVLRQLERVVAQWTFVSTPCATMIDTLRCTIRLQAKFQHETDNTPLAWGDGGPPSGTWIFLELCQRFFRYGLKLQASEDRYNLQTHFIRKLIIDLKSSELEEGTEWWRPPTTGVRRPYLLGKTMRLDPLYFFNILEFYMEHVLDCGYHTGNYGCLVYEHVGDIEFRKDGKLFSHYDLNAKLIEYRTVPMMPMNKMTPADLRIHHTRLMWIPLVERLRAERGLGPKVVMEDKDDTVTAEAVNDTHYISWDQCLSLVRATRPETRSPGT